MENISNDVFLSESASVVENRVMQDAVIITPEVNLRRDEGQNHMQSNENVAEERLVYGVSAYREMLYEANPGRNEIVICREKGKPISQEETLAIFRNMEDSHFYQKPCIKFEGEQGIDVGGLSREFAYQSITSWFNEPWGFKDKIPLFDGQQDLWLPTTNLKPVKEGAFQIVGASMKYFGVHADFAFLGLHPLCKRYIIEENVSKLDLMSWDITIEDMPDHELQEVARELLNIANGKDCKNLEVVQDAMDELKIYVCVPELKPVEAEETLQQLKYNYIFGSRLRALTILRQTFRSGKFWDWAQHQYYSVERMFLLLKEFPVTPEIIIASFSNSHEFPIYSVFLHKFLHNCVLQNKKLEEFLLWLTTYPFVSDGKLRFEMVPAYSVVDLPGSGTVRTRNSVCAHACFNQLDVPEDTTEESFLYQLHTAVYIAPRMFDDV